MAVLGAVVGGFVLGNVVGMLAMLVLVPLVWLVTSVSTEIAGLVAVVVVIGGVFVALWTARNPGDESGEAILFAMMAGVGAAMIVAGAEAATSLAAQRKSDTGLPGSLVGEAGRDSAGPVNVTCCCTREIAHRTTSSGVPVPSRCAGSGSYPRISG